MHVGGHKIHETTDQFLEGRPRLWLPRLWVPFSTSCLCAFMQSDCSSINSSVTANTEKCRASCLRTREVAELCRHRKVACRCLEFVSRGDDSVFPIVVLLALLVVLDADYGKHSGEASVGVKASSVLGLEWVSESQVPMFLTSMCSVTIGLKA